MLLRKTLLALAFALPLALLAQESSGEAISKPANSSKKLRFGIGLQMYASQTAGAMKEGLLQQAFDKTIGDKSQAGPYCQSLPVGYLQVTKPLSAGWGISMQAGLTEWSRVQGVKWVSSLPPQFQPLMYTARLQSATGYVSLLAKYSLLNDRLDLGLGPVLGYQFISSKNNGYSDKYVLSSHKTWVGISANIGASIIRKSSYSLKLEANCKWMIGQQLMGEFLVMRNNASPGEGDYKTLAIDQYKASLLGGGIAVEF